MEKRQCQNAPAEKMNLNAGFSFSGALFIILLPLNSLKHSSAQRKLHEQGRHIILFIQ